MRRKREQWDRRKVRQDDLDFSGQVGEADGFKLEVS